MEAVRRLVVHLAVAGSAAALAAVAGAYPVVEPAGGVAAFTDRGKNALVLSTDRYQLTLSKRNGQITELRDSVTGDRLLTGQGSCLWSMGAGNGATAGGCAFTPTGGDRFAYSWDRGASTLTLTYKAAKANAAAVATITATPTGLELRLKLTNELASGNVTTVLFPRDLRASSATVDAGYAPNFLPGIRLRPGFFSRVGNDIYTYPSRWAFADYVSLDIGQSHLALYSKNPPPSPLAPVDVGFVHAADGVCGGPSFCFEHTFQTAVSPGQTWTSPVVRLEVGSTARESILGYRTANGIDAYPSLAAKLGPLFESVVGSPLIKADLRKGLPPFAAWGPDLARLPSPALVHPVAYQPGGHDMNDPDFLPPDPAFGSEADFNGAIAKAHSLGLTVMPYANASWWDGSSPTARSLDPPLTIDDLSVQDSTGKPKVETYFGRSGYVVSPFAPFVKTRFDQMLEQWKTDVPVDCVFLDQIGARPWLRDFNPLAPSPIAYADGWLSLLAPYKDRCLMVEDGWDRLAATFAGFHGGLLLMAREFDEPDRDWGEGNWEPYPLADWLLHDKVLFFQHDLYEPTMTTNLYTLTWNAAFGFQQSYAWSGLSGDSLDDPWLQVAGDFQHVLGPRVGGRTLDAYDQPAPGITVSRFGDLEVRANWNDAPGSVDGYGIASNGFLARAQGLVAGAFAGTFGGVALTPGTHCLIVATNGGSVEVRQPLGADTPVAVTTNAQLATGYTSAGVPIGAVPVARRGTQGVFTYQGTLGGTPVAYYRLS